MNAIRQFLNRVKQTGVKRSGSVKTVSMGRERAFAAYDIGNDTFIFEKGIAAHLDERPSILVALKSSLRRRAHGMVFTFTTGNHSVAAFPLLDGRFWRLSNVPMPRRGEVLMREILCANAVGSIIEVAQRDIPTHRLVEFDAWLTGPAGFSLRDIVMGERNPEALDHYRLRGEEWRVKPLAWTDRDMRVALSASRKRIASSIVYYHSTKGVHFLTYPEFSRFAGLAQTDYTAFQLALRELVSLYEGNTQSFLRMPKYRGHHEVELFGLPRGLAASRLVPPLEQLMEEITLGRIGQLGVIQRIQEIAALYLSLLSQAELADETTTAFAETLYMYITGEIYSVVGEGSTPAFDDRRTALPGATFRDGRMTLHPGTDVRTEILLSNIRGLMSKDEIVEYANVYELHSQDDAGLLGRGPTREVVYKTSHSPLERSLIEKRLSQARKGYGSYMLARVKAFKALGVDLSEYRLLRRRGEHGRRPLDFYIRRRCEGEPLASIPANYFCNADDASIEERDVILAIATLMGDAAAQNMAMRKYDAETESPLFGVGKEIYEFEYDIIAQRVVPKKVSTCSVRGSFGWPDLSQTDENLQKMGAFYLQHYAHALKVFQRQHNVSMDDLAERFMGGFEFRTHAMEWQLSVMRDRFEAFAPPVPAEYRFPEKWRFVTWALERQDRRLPILRKMFFEKVAVESNL